MMHRLLSLQLIIPKHNHPIAPLSLHVEYGPDRHLGIGDVHERRELILKQRQLHQEWVRVDPALILLRCVGG